jgi:hypothetical protein
VFGVVINDATPEPSSEPDPTVAPPTRNEIVPVGTTPDCVATVTLIVVVCPSVIVLEESPKATTGVIFAAGFTISDAVFELPEA